MIIEHSTVEILTGGACLLALNQILTLASEWDLRAIVGLMVSPAKWNEEGKKNHANSTTYKGEGGVVLI